MKLIETTDFKELRSIELQVGPMCNMHCRHCQQMPEKSVSLHYEEPTEDVLQFFDNFVRFLQQKQFIETARGNIEPMFRIMFYGGEALLYWKVWRKIVEHFTDKYNILSNDVFRFVVTTNGTFINEEFVEFANKYQLFVVFSYDAPYPFAVRDYVSDEVCEKVKRIHGHEIQCNYSAYNCDQMLAYRCTKAKFPKAKVQVNLKMLRTFTEMPEDTYRNDLTKVRTAIRKIRIAFQMGDPYFGNWVLNRYLIPGAISRGYFVPDIGNERILCVGLDGNINLAFNSDVFVTTVDDSLDTVYKKIFSIKVGLLGPACKICRHREICKVPLYDIHDEAGNYVSCLDFYLAYYDIVREEMGKTKYPLTKEDIEWFHEQEKIMEKQIQNYLNEGKRYEREHTRLPKDMMYMIEGKE